MFRVQHLSSLSLRLTQTRLIRGGHRRRRGAGVEHFYKTLWNFFVIFGNNNFCLTFGHLIKMCWRHLPPIIHQSTPRPPIVFLSHCVIRQCFLVSFIRIKCAFKTHYIINDRKVLFIIIWRIGETWGTVSWAPPAHFNWLLISRTNDEFQLFLFCFGISNFHLCQTSITKHVIFITLCDMPFSHSVL